MNTLKRQLSRWIYNFVQIQLFLSLAALPFIAAWGLPYSLMTLVGNMLFNPLISLFLIIASLFFFTELLSIPNTWLIIMLEKTTSLLTWCLSFGKKTWLIGLSLPQTPLICFFLLFLLFIIPLVTIQRIRSWRLELCALFFILFIFISGFYCLKPVNKTFIIACTQKKAVKIEITQKAFVRLFDQGTFLSARATPSWISYTLLPELRKKSGITTIHSIIVSECNPNTFKALAHLISNIKVFTIFMPYFEPFKNKADWRLYFEFKRICQAEKIKIIKIKNKTQTKKHSVQKNIRIKTINALTE